MQHYVPENPAGNLPASTVEHLRFLRFLVMQGTLTEWPGEDTHIRLVIVPTGEDNGADLVRRTARGANRVR